MKNEKIFTKKDMPLVKDADTKPWLRKDTTVPVSKKREALKLDAVKGAGSATTEFAM